MDNLLEIKDLKIDFYIDARIINAVDGANLYLSKNEVLVLAGESGSGKTVTALAITKVLPQNAKIIAGSVKFYGQDLLKLDEKKLISIRGREIAYIFQEATSFLNPVYTVGSQIAEAIMLHQDKTKHQAYLEAERLLDLVKIKEPAIILKDYPHQLSGGMNQRAFIAMALACRPKLLIADEPTTSLDVTTEAQILELLMVLKGQLDFSLLFITHNLSIAKRIADRICIMYKGKIVEEGLAEKIFTQPEHFHTRKLIRAYEKIGKLR